MGGLDGLAGRQVGRQACCAGGGGEEYQESPRLERFQVSIMKAGSGAAPTMIMMLKDIRGR